MESYWQGSASTVAAQRDWTNYFPTASPEDFANGFYDRVEELQGVQNTYYVGSYLSFELVDISEWFAREFILRKFDNYTEVGPMDDTSEKSGLGNNLDWLVLVSLALFGWVASK